MYDIFKVKLANCKQERLLDFICQMKLYNKRHQKMINDCYRYFTNKDVKIDLLDVAFNRECESIYHNAEIYVENSMDKEFGFGKLAKVCFFNHTLYVIYPNPKGQEGYTSLLEKRLEVTGAKTLDKEETNVVKGLGL